MNMITGNPNLQLLMKTYCHENFGYTVVNKGYYTYISTLSIGSFQLLYQSIRINISENIHIIPNNSNITILE